MLRNKGRCKQKLWRSPAKGKPHWNKLNLQERDKPSPPESHCSSTGRAGTVPLNLSNRQYAENDRDYNNPETKAPSQSCEDGNSQVPGQDLLNGQREGSFVGSVTAGKFSEENCDNTLCPPEQSTVIEKVVDPATDRPPTDGATIHDRLSPGGAVEWWICKQCVHAELMTYPYWSDGLKKVKTAVHYSVPTNHGGFCHTVGSNMITISKFVCYFPGVGLLILSPH